MAPKSHTRDSRDSQVQGRYLLRIIAAITVTCGLFLNIITIVTISKTRGWRSAKTFSAWAFLPLGASLIWDVIQLLSGELWDCFAPLQRAGDLLATLGFVALLITNGVVAGNLGYSIDDHGDKVMLLAYNSFPWIICALIHIAFVISPHLGGFDCSNLPRLRLVWPEATHTPLVHHEDYDEEVEVQSRKESTDSQRDNEDTQPLLGSS